MSQILFGARFFAHKLKYFHNLYLQMYSVLFSDTMCTRNGGKIVFINLILWEKFGFLWNLFQTVSTASELRKPIYWIVAGKAIDYEQMLLLMANVKWDVKEIMSQHNIYVDTLLKASILGNPFVKDVYSMNTL